VLGIKINTNKLTKSDPKSRLDTVLGPQGKRPRPLIVAQSPLGAPKAEGNAVGRLSFIMHGAIAIAIDAVSGVRPAGGEARVSRCRHQQNCPPISTGRCPKGSASLHKHQFPSEAKWLVSILKCGEPISQVWRYSGVTAFQV
jgi:hypothetical protein